MLLRIELPNDDVDTDASNYLKRVTGVGGFSATRQNTRLLMKVLFLVGPCQPSSYADGDDLTKLLNLVLPTS